MICAGLKSYSVVWAKFELYNNFLGLGFYLSLIFVWFLFSTSCLFFNSSAYFYSYSDYFFFRLAAWISIAESRNFYALSLMYALDIGAPSSTLLQNTYSIIPSISHGFETHSSLAKQLYTT